MSELKKARAGEDTVARARALIGVRFRPQGRCASGIDCVGLAAVAGGVSVRDVRRDYGLRENDPDALAAGFVANGFGAVPAADARAGDMLVVRAGFSQLHVVVLTPEGFVHADAGLGRVVEVPGAVGWPVISAWRCVGKVREEGSSLCSLPPPPSFQRCCASPEPRTAPPLAPPAVREGE